MILIKKENVELMKFSKFNIFFYESGVTLLEVMVAVAIVSITFVSFISLLLSSLEMEEYARRLTEATLIADNRLKEIERTGFPELAQAEGPVDEKEPSGFFFKQAVIETPIEDVRQVDLEIYWDNKRNYVSMSAYMVKK